MRAKIKETALYESGHLYPKRLDEKHLFAVIDCDGKQSSHYYSKETAQVIANGYNRRTSRREK